MDAGEQVSLSFGVNFSYVRCVIRCDWCVINRVIEQAVQKISEIKQEIGDKKCELSVAITQ